MYLIDPEKYRKWLNAVSPGSVNTLKFLDKNIKVGTKFTNEVKMPKFLTDIQSDAFIKTKNKPIINYGTVTKYEPPFLFATEHKDGKGIVHTVSLNEYTFKKTSNGTKISMHSESYLKYDSTGHFSIFLIGHLLKLLPLPYYFMVLGAKNMMQSKIKEFFSAFGGTAGQITERSLEKLKDIIEYDL